MNDAKKNLINGTFIYFIGNALVGILQLLILKCITTNINSVDYGYFNLIITIDNLVTPIFTFQIGDAVFKYVITGSDNEKRTAYTNGVVVIVSGIIVLTVSIVIFSMMFHDVQYIGLVIAYIASTNLFTFYQKIIRALGKNIEYVNANLKKVIIYLLLQLFFIYIVKLQVESLFLAMTLSTIICMITMEKNVKTREYFDWNLFDKKFLKIMLLFSAPLIPNTILWWLSGSINSLVITTVIGLAANGIYTLAGRFSTVVSTFANVFNLAWQESAIREYGETESGKFYNETFQTFYRLIMSVVGCCIPLMALVFPYMIDISYYEAIRYAPILVISAGFSAINGFFGSMYAATGKTIGAFSTTVFGVVANLAVLVIGIKFMGLMAPCLATLFSALLITWMRYKQFKNEMCLTLNSSILYLAIEILAVTACYYFSNTIINILALIGSLFIAIIINKGFIQDLFKIVFGRLRRK